MNIVDVILLCLLAGAVILALRHIRRSRKNGGGMSVCAGCPSADSCGGCENNRRSRG